jgi:hypothetical protein
MKTLLWRYYPCPRRRAGGASGALATFLWDRIGFAGKELADLQVLAKVFSSKQQEVGVFDQHTHPGVESRSPLCFHFRGEQ